MSKGSVASGRVGVWAYGRMGVPACGRIGVMSGSRLGCERLSGLMLVVGLQRMGSAFFRRRGTTARRASMGLMGLIGSNADTPMRRQVNFTTVSPASTPMVWVMLTWAHS